MNRPFKTGPESHDSTAEIDVYPTLSGKLGFDQRDVDRLTAASNHHQVTVDTIPTFVLGTVINMIDSTYNNTPIFNLGNLDKDGLLDLNPQSASQDDISIKMVSNKAAYTFSYKAAAKSETSANLLGFVGAGLAAQFDQSLSRANSDGNVYVSMSRGKHDSYFEINAADLASGYDFTPYLIGTELSDDEVAAYVDYSEVNVEEGKGTYIDTLIFNGNQGKGQIDWAVRNVYGNVQLLTRMEAIFGMMRAQYDAFVGDEAVQNILYSNMLTMKKRIGDAIQDFYTHVGTHFVSKLEFANYAYGYGTLDFSDAATNQEARFGAAVSLSGGVPAKFSAASESSVSFAQANGWAEAMKNLTIEASSRPSGMDLGSFASEIKAMLNDEGTALSVPSLYLPTSPTVTVKAVPDLKKKKSSAPPDCVFANYGEWQAYQKALKDKKNLDATVKRCKKKVDEKGTDSLEVETGDENGNAIEAPSNLYEAYAEEMALLKSRAESPVEDGAANDSTGLRIEDMFVSGFKTTSYDTVIPALRTSKIVLPDTGDEVCIYPNATLLLMVMDSFRQVADYTNFISKFTVSNVSAAFNDQIHDFYDQFSAKGYAMVTDHIAQGTDIDPQLLNDFAVAMYGHSDGSKLMESLLYQTFGSNIDKASYVKYLLQPEVKPLWADAPGGYAPFLFDDSENLCFAKLDHLKTVDIIDAKTGMPGSDFKTQLHFDTGTKVTKLPEDLSLLYQGRTETPLFPIFRYEQKNNPRFLFLQTSGNFQLIYGQNGLIHPFRIPRTRTTDRTLDLATGTLAADALNITEKLIKPLIDEIEGFDLEKDLNTRYALYFPDTTQTEELRKNYRVLHIALPNKPQPEKKVVVSPDPRAYAAYVFMDSWSALNGHLIDDGVGGYLVTVKGGRQKRVNGGLHVLLPIDYSKITGDYGSLLLGNSYGQTIDYINSPTYDAGVITSMHR
ncbi:hypothetical protein [uncultured Desulfuromonas sp.]|uniref:hypothetical protein n=1 Tax=uncultured Desulfuromonas sp. TaxID=181013 RepID=UPI002AAC0097|nr:hypothetical protein [uncultured Desulfuromonas sp.]